MLAQGSIIFFLFSGILKWILMLINLILINIDICEIECRIKMLYLNKTVAIWKLAFCILFLYRLGHGPCPCRGGNIPVTPWLGNPPDVGWWKLDVENLYKLNIIKLHMTKSGCYDRYTLKYTKEKAFKAVFTIYFN